MVDAQITVGCVDARVRQRCVMALQLFNIYMKNAMKDWKLRTPAEKKDWKWVVKCGRQQYGSMMKTLCCSLNVNKNYGGWYINLTQCV